MRRITVAVVALSAAISVTGSAWVASGQAAAVGCAPGHARLVAADAQAEVYIANEPYYEVGTHEQLGTEAFFRGCVYGSRRSFRLGPDFPGSPTTQDTTRHITLAGAVVAYSVEDVVGESVAEFYVIVRDLRTGRVLADVPSGVPLKKTGRYDIGVGGVEGLVVKSDGAVAWIAFDGLRTTALERMTGQRREFYCDLYALDKTGERLLASGIELAPASLALAGSTVYWTQGGKPFSALLH